MGTLTLPQMDAGTLNCPDCGAAVPAKATECSFCHARLATIGCDKCFGMVFAGSRHCQHCGAAVKTPAERDAPPLLCPRRCGDMRGVRFGGADMWECPACSGLWVDNETVQRLIAERLKPAPLLGTGITVPPPVRVRLSAVQYAPCPQCRTLMNRQNFAHTSGVIVDVCSQHGTWFDADELRRVLEFVAAGGLENVHVHELAKTQLASGDHTPAEMTTINLVKSIPPMADKMILSIVMDYVSRSKPKP